MNKSRYITTLLVAASSMGLLETQAFAENQDADMKPIVFMVLDTSGSMNDFIDEGKNETRLTAALGEIIGSSKNMSAGKRVRMESTSDVLNMPFPEWNCDASGCRYFYKTKTIRGAKQIAKPKIDNVSNYASNIAAAQKVNEAYDDNGIIQAYQSLVKFGFAGMAVGSAGSTASKDSPLKAVAAAAGGAVKDVALRFTMVWDEGDYNSNSDLDSHCWEFRDEATAKANDSSKYASSYDYHIYFGDRGYSTHGGRLDVDITQPWYGVRVDGFYNNKPVGVENIYYKDTSKMKAGNVFDFSVHSWAARNNKPDGFRAEISYLDANSCPVTNSFNRSAKITTGNPGSGTWRASGVYPVARVKYNGKIDGVDSFSIISSNMEYTTDGSGGEPVHIYGYDSYPSATKIGHNIYGRKLSAIPYKKPSDCSLDSGMWDSHIDADAPLVYPTVQNDEDSIEDSNRALIEKVRTYQSTSSTPIGEVLADLYYMFGLDSSDNLANADPNLISQKLAYGAAPTKDDYYPCRKKAVVFISDGGPNGSGLTGTDDDDKEKHGHSKQVWHDAFHLYKNGVPVYVVGYAQFGSAAPCLDGDNSCTDENRQAATVLNKMALKGGTCYNEKGEFIDPNEDETLESSKYYQFVKNFDKHHKYCFINAGDGAALRKALSEFMSDITQSVVSKTRVVNTSAISYRPLNGYAKYDKNFTSGWYNVYSGYNSTLGNIPKSILYRKATLCQNGSGAGDSAGKFEIDSDYEIDMSNLLTQRLSSCAKATSKSTTCLQSRYIFTGDYATDRYKLTPDIVPLSAQNIDGKTAGLIANAVSGSAFNYLTKDVEKKTIACENEYNKSIDSYAASANYILSPYECVNDFDCNVNAPDGSNLMCELGRCTDKTLSSCTSMSSGKICIANVAVDRKSSCSKHADCRLSGPDFVCHAGECVQGTVKSCDARSFVANQRLGSIEYATPVVVEPPTRAYRGHNYAAMSQKYWDRDTMLLAGANDGMLHAFVLGSNNETQFKVSGDGKYSPKALNDGAKNAPATITEGQELWGFIPKSVLPTIQRLTSFEPNKYVNASPVVQDVLLPANADPVLYPEDTYKNGKTNVVNAWRTVVVGGFRDGARGYYALDITDPAKPRILWEIGPTWQPTKNPTTHKDLGDNATVSSAEVLAQSKLASNEGFPFLQMGYTYAEPIITYATTSLVDGKAMIEPVAILPGGIPKGNTTTANDETGKVLYVVRLFPNSKEDLIVKTFHFDHAISGSPQVYPSTFKSTAQLLYVGDDIGNLYRINLKGTPDKWASNDVNIAGTFPIQNPVFKASSLDGGSLSGGLNYERITERPAVARFNKDYAAYDTIQIAFGTGSNENFIINSDQKNYIAMFFDVPDENGKYTLNNESIYTQLKPTAIVFNKSASDESVINGAELEKNTKFVARKTDPISKETILSRQKMTGAPIIYNFDAYFPAYVADDESVSTCGLGSARIYKMSSALGNSVHYEQATAQNMGNQFIDKATKTPFKEESYIEIAGTRIYGLEITKQMTCLSKEGSSTAAPQLVAMTGQTTDPGVKANEQDKLLGQTGAGQITTVALNLEAIQPVTREAKWATVYE